MNKNHALRGGGASAWPVPSRSSGALGGCPTDSLGPLPTGLTQQLDILSAVAEIGEAPPPQLLLPARSLASGWEALLL